MTDKSVLSEYAEYSEVFKRVGREYPDVRVGLDHETGLYHYAYAYPVERRLYLIPSDLQHIIRTEEDLLFVLLHEIGHCENLDMALWFAGDRLTPEFIADSWACQHGSSVETAVGILRRIEARSENKWALRARIEHLERKNGTEDNVPDIPEFKVG